MQNPKFFSREFHKSFFPVIIKNRLHLLKKKNEGITFTSKKEIFILVAVCLILMVIGIPFASEGAVWGWIMGILGVGGTIVLVIFSIMGQKGVHPTYDDFLIGVFLFFVVLGAFIGLPVGMEAHSFSLGFLASIVGLAAGYITGILCGMWLQYLGWIAIVINVIASFGAIILSGTALIILLALAI